MPRSRKSLYRDIPSADAISVPRVIAGDTSEYLSLAVAPVVLANDNQPKAGGAGGKSSAFDNDILNLILNGTLIANIADNAASSPLTSLYLSMHTADPGAGGSQNTSEAAYIGYARQAVPRNGAGFTITGTTANLTTAAIFPTATGGSEMETWAAVGTAATGPGKILYRGPITPTLTVSVGASPQLSTATALTES